MAATIDRDLAHHLDRLGKQAGDTVKVEEVGDVVRSLLDFLVGGRVDRRSQALPKRLR